MAVVMQFTRPERFRQAVTASLKKTYPADAYPQLLDLLRSPLARRMTAIWQQQQPNPDLQAFAAGLKQTAPGAQRLAIVNRIDQLTLASDNTGTLREALGVAGVPMSAKQIDVDRQAGEKVRQARLVLRLYRYRDEPEDQLREYAGMLASPVLVRFYESVRSGMAEAERQALADLVQTIQRRGRK